MVRALSRILPLLLTYVRTQNEPVRDLVEETEKNKDDITHFELLQQHFHERI